jgi:hypothetical protein
MGFRLTAHIDNVKKIRVEDGFNNKTKKPNSKEILINTISIRNIPSRAQVEVELLKLRDKYTIAKGSNSKKMHKYGKELIYVSNEK